MSQKINPREVLSYLNELGYVNITAQQLKEFIKDLKKLIKYECSHEEITTKRSTSNIPDNHQNTGNDKYDNYEKKREEYDVFHALHDHNTVASKARTESRRGKQISLYITKTKNMKKLHDHCIHVNKQTEREGKNDELVLHEREENRTTMPSSTNPTEIVSNNENLETSSKESLKRPSSKEIIGPTSKESMSSAPIKSKKSKSSVIKVGSIKSINRCDPVALYHQYKEEWKKIKFPGQDHHSDLRWAVREKLLSGPPVRIPLRKSSSKLKM